MTTTEKTDQRTDKRAALMALVDEKIEELARARDAAELTEKINAYARLQATFWRYSLRNTVLIEEQLRERGKTPTHVAGFHAWLRLNRVPQKGTGIAIFAPSRYRERDEETGEEQWQLRGFRLTHVFDVSDTTVLPGRPDLYRAALPTWHTVEGDYQPLFVRLLDCARRQKIKVEIGPGEEGLRGWSSGTGHIWLNDQLTSGQRCGTMLHELAHELAHDLERRRKAREEEHGRARLECEAEASAHCLATHLGVPRPDSAMYMALHGISASELRRSLEAIRSVVCVVLTAIEGPDDIASTAFAGGGA